MAEEKQTIQQALKPFRRRLHLEAFEKAVIFGAVFGAGAGLLLLAGSYVLPVRISFRHALFAAAAVFVLTVGIVFCLTRPGRKQIVGRLDALGLQDRVCTMLELQEETTAFAALQRADTLRKLDALEPAKLRLSYPKKMIAVGSALTILFVCAAFLPNPHREKLEAAAVQKQQTQETVERFLETLEKKVNEAELSPEHMEEAREILEELQEALRKMESSTEKLAKLTEASDRLTDLFRQNRKEQQQTAADEFEKTPITKELGEALRQGDSDKIQESLKNLADALQEAGQLSSEQQQQWMDAAAQAFASAADRLSPSSLQEALQKGSEALSQDAADMDWKQLAETMRQIGEQLGGTLGDQKAQDVQDLLDDLKESIRPDASESGGTEGTGGEAGTEGTGNGSDSSNGGFGDNSGGEGAGLGAGQTVEQQECVFDPSFLGGGGEESYVPGKKNEAGESQRQELGEAQLEEGSVPYQELLREYAERAGQAMDREGIPDDVRDVVGRYFSSLS